MSDDGIGTALKDGIRQIAKSMTESIVAFATWMVLMFLILVGLGTVVSWNLGVESYDECVLDVMENQNQKYMVGHARKYCREQFPLSKR